jgi:putative peptide zinc metalloprotease protein
VSEARGQTFSDAWHRVAGLRAALRPDVKARRQSAHGRHWYVLSNPLSNEFFRISEDAYAFVSRLAADRTVEDVWRDTLAHDTESMLSQQEVVQLLGQLNLSNLLQADRAGASGSLFERYRQRRARERRAKLMSVLSFRIPLLDPDRMLERTLPLIRALISPVGLLAYLLLLGLGVKALMDRGDDLYHQAAGVLAPDNLVLLYLGFVIAKVVHEFAHAAVCKRFGGEVHTMGVMFLLFAPLPFVDASASWGFRRTAPRMLVGAAGVLAELAVAAIAALVWAYSAPGVGSALAYNVIFAASVSTLVFNLNPLLRFDGYHMLVDLINMPNLFQRSRDQLRYLGQRYLLGVKHLKPAAQSRLEAWLLPLYGASSALYALMLMATIAFFVAEQYLDLGLLLALLLVASATVLPLFKLARHLFSSPQLAHQRTRAIASAVVLASVVFGVLGWVPMPDRVRAPGVVESSAFRQLSSESAGFLAELLAKPGSRVSAGQALLRLENPGLLADIRASRTQLQQIQAQEVRAQALALADLAPLRQQRLAAQSGLADLERQRAALTVIAPVTGVWSAGEVEHGRGRWFARGAAMGAIVDDSGHRFVAILPQVATHVFKGQIEVAELRLGGEDGHNLVLRDVSVMPFEQGVLPSRALGFAGGGDIAVQPGDPSGLTAAEPFFRIHAHFDAAQAAEVTLVHGRLGVMRLTLPPKPLLEQWERSLRQLLQRRFRV